MTINKETVIISNEVKEQVLREYFKNRARKARHGDTETVEKRGRKRIPDELREEHRKNYYETVTKPRQIEKRRLAKEEAIRNGTYRVKKLGRPRKKVE
jgi:hypothetical protein